MFWGLIMEPNKRYTQTVEKPFHISQAAMDTSTGDKELCQVMVVVDGKNFLICTLQKGGAIQVPLDLYFKTGNVVSFLTNGKSNIHLTGYLDPEFDESLSDAEEASDEEEAPELVPAKGKRKLEEGIEASNAKKLKQEAKKQLKKQLDVKPEDSDDDDSEDAEGEEEEDDSSDDGDDDLQKLLDGDVDSDENDDSFQPNSNAGDDSGEDSEEAEEEDSSKLDSTMEADTSKEEPKLSKSQKRKLKKLQAKKKAAEAQAQTNGVDKKAAAKSQQQQKEQKEQKKGKEGKQQETKAASPEKREKKSLSGGVQIEDMKVGSGPVAKPGKEVEVYYEGRLKQNNKMFDSCNKGPGFRFKLGHKEVISGWDVGVAGMKVGGKRKIVCPPAMAYGNKGSPPVIPPNSTLVFEVELKKIK